MSDLPLLKIDKNWKLVVPVAMKEALNQEYGAFIHELNTYEGQFISSNSLSSPKRPHRYYKPLEMLRV
jgi:hypothetical protein